MRIHRIILNWPYMQKIAKIEQLSVTQTLYNSKEFYFSVRVRVIESLLHQHSILSGNTSAVVICISIQVLAAIQVLLWCVSATIEVLLWYVSAAIQALLWYVSAAIQALLWYVSAAIQALLWYVSASIQILLWYVSAFRAQR